MAVERGEVVFDHVTFGYMRSEPVLRDFSLRVEPGETVALVGTSGSGKSTVALLLPRFYDVHDGSVRIDDVDVRDVALASLRSCLGVVFEESFLFSDSIRSNIAFGRPDATGAEIEAAARAAEAHNFIMELPLGYDTVVGEQGLTLSGGQRQRVALARRVAVRPARAAPRRRHIVRRRARRGRDSRNAAATARGPHNAVDRAPPFHPHAGRPHRRRRRWSRCRHRYPRRAVGTLRGVPHVAVRSRRGCRRHRRREGCRARRQRQRRRPGRRHHARRVARDPAERPPAALDRHDAPPDRADSSCRRRRGWDGCGRPRRGLGRRARANSRIDGQGRSARSRERRPARRRRIRSRDRRRTSASGSSCAATSSG